LSRDAVDPTEQQPESMNPYQFAYQNPLIYSDPTGKTTISELNVSQVINDILESISKNAQGQISKRVIDEAKGVATQIFQNTLRSLNPFSNFGIGGFSQINLNPQYQGELFSIFMQAAFCQLMSSAFPQFLSYGHFEVEVDPTGTPRSSAAYQCSPNGAVNLTNAILANNISRPDFIIKKGDPFTTDSRTRGGDPAFLIGDFKRQVTTIKSTGKGSNQWLAINNYARGHQYVPVALYVTLFGSDRANQTREATLKARSARLGVNLQIISFL
jgi:hypothetical protein